MSARRLAVGKPRGARQRRAIAPRIHLSKSATGILLPGFVTACVLL
jgi:hypothetical protein